MAETVDKYARRILQKYRLSPDGWSYRIDQISHLLDEQPWTAVLTPGEVRLVNQDNADPVVIRSFGVTGPQLHLHHIRGTSDAPTATQSGDSIGIIKFGGSNGTTTAHGATLEAIAAATVASGSAFSSSASQIGGDSINGSWASTGQQIVTGIGIVGDYITVATMSQYPAGSTGSTPKLYRYQISTNTWTNVAPAFPAGTTWISNIVVYNNVCYYGIGGDPTMANGNRFFSYDPTTNTNTALATQANFAYCWHVALDSDNGVIYTADTGGTSFKVYQHVIGSGTWTNVVNSAMGSWAAGSGSYMRVRWHSDGFVYISIQNNVGRSRIYRYNISTTSLTAIGGYLIGGNLGNKTQFPNLIQFGAYMYVSTSDGEIWEWNNGTSFWTQIGGDGLNSSWSTTNTCVGAIAYNNFVYWSVRNGSSLAELWQFTPDGSGATAGTWAKVGNSPGSYEDFYTLAVNSSTGIMYAGMGVGVPDADFWALGTVAGAAVASTNVQLQINISGTLTTVLKVFSDGDVGVGLGADGIYWDESAQKAGILTTAPARTLHVNGTDGMRIAQGSPSVPATGDLYIAASTGILTWHDGTAARRTAHAPAALTDNSLIRGDGGATGLQTSGILVSDLDAVTGVTLLGLEDTDGTHNLSLKWNENSAANHTLNILGCTTADRSLTFTADATIGGTNSGDVTLAGTPDYLTIAGQVITRGQIDLATDVTGDLPYANLTAAGAASKLLGRGDSGAGDWQEITIGTGLTMTGTTLSSSGGSGGYTAGWDLISSWTYSTDVTSVPFTNLSGFSDIRILVVGVTLQNNGTRDLQVSVDNGSTYLTSSGDYVGISAAGVETNTTQIPMNDTGSTSARSGEVTIYGTNLTSQKTAEHESGGTTTLYRIPTANDIDAVRVIPSGGGNITGGSIYVFGRVTAANVPAHASRHYEGGADEIDILQLGNYPGTYTFLRGDGAFALPVDPSVQSFRLTLASGYPVYNPLPATPNSTDTTAETTSFAAAHGWVSGTIVTVSATGGGLTAGTRYYINATSSTSCSYHTTVADAIAATNKVNLTASITAQIIPSGISNTTLYFTPYTANTIALYNGTGWVGKTSAEISIALGTLTSALPYDVFAYDNSGTLTLELVAWTSDTARNTAITRVDGVYTKNGTNTKRYVGTIRTDSTTTTIDDYGGIASQVGGKRFVWNNDNRVPREMMVKDTTDSWASANTVRQADNATGNKVEFVQGLSEDAVFAQTIHSVLPATGVAFGSGVGVNSTTVMSGLCGRASSSAVGICLVGRWSGQIPIGYNFLAWLEGASNTTGTWYGDDARTFVQSGMQAEIQC